MTPNERVNKILALFSMRKTFLARSLNVDSSLVSKWATGKRRLDEKSPYLMPIARIFASYPTSADIDLRARHLFNTMDEGVSSEQYAKKIYEFLLGIPEDADPTIEAFREVPRCLGRLPTARERALKAYTPGNPLTYEVYEGGEGLGWMLHLLHREMLEMPPEQRVFTYIGPVRSDAWWFEDFVETLFTFLKESQADHICMKAMVGIQGTEQTLFRLLSFWRAVVPGKQLKLSALPSCHADMMPAGMFLLPGRLCVQVEVVDQDVRFVIKRDSMSLRHGLRYCADIRRYAQELLRRIDVLDYREISRYYMKGPTGCIRIFGDGIPEAFMPEGVYRSILSRAHLSKDQIVQNCQAVQIRAKMIEKVLVHKEIRLLITRRSLERMLNPEGYSYHGAALFATVDVYVAWEEVAAHLRHFVALCRAHRSLHLLVLEDEMTQGCVDYRMVMQEQGTSYISSWMNKDDPELIVMHLGKGRADLSQMFDKLWERVLFTKAYPRQDLDALELRLNASNAVT